MNTGRRSRNQRSAAVPAAAATPELGRWNFVAPSQVRSGCGRNARARESSARARLLHTCSKGRLETQPRERGCIRRRPAAAALKRRGDPLKSDASRAANRLRLVFHAHGRAPGKLLAARKNSSCHVRPVPTSSLSHSPAPNSPAKLGCIPPTTTARADSQSIRFRLRPPHESGAKIPRASPASRAATGDRSRSFRSRLRRSVLIVSLWCSQHFPLPGYGLAPV